MDQPEKNDQIKGTTALNIIMAEISNRQMARAQLWEKIVSLDGEIAGLRQAQHQIDKLIG